MVQPRRWWLGLIPLALLWLIAVWLKTPAVEQDILHRTTAAISGPHLDNARASVAGRDVALSADAFSEDIRTTAVAKADAVDGVRLVDARIGLVPEIKPYIFTATRDAGKLTLTGHVPLPEVRAKLVNAARSAAAGADVADQTSYGRGAAAGFDAMALLALAQLDKLSAGKASIADKDVAITGIANNVASRDAIAAALRNLPAGFRLTENSVKAPPYVFSALKDAAAGTLTLSGAVPDAATHQTILNAVKRAFFADRAVDNLVVAAGAPVGFGDAATTLLAQLARLVGGAATLSDTDAELKGEALYARAGDQINAAIANGMPSAFRTKAQVTVKPSAGDVDGGTCQQLFVDLLAKGTILFETGKSAIEPDSTAMLDHLVAIALRCSKSSIEVSGHTDSSGSSDANMELSKRRAQSVVDYLVGAGLDTARLGAVGYGSARPVASNDTEEGRAKNRRIEFVVR